jgi:type II secretory ATPase GspE/PulE/Tfp pilus assembly ATPase PilB-like protein
MPVLQLTPIRGKTGVIRLTDDRITIGRHPDNTVVLEDDRASRHHCEIVRRPDGTWQARDLKSRNGIKHNDVRVAEALLSPGDILQIGGHEYLVETAPDEDPGDSAAHPAPDPLAEEHVHSLAPESLGAGRPALDWKPQLESMIDALPPRDMPREQVQLIDASGRLSPALAGNADGPTALRLLLQLASKARATDVHMEAKPDLFHIRIRVDGAMVWIIDLPLRVGELIYGLVKTAAQMRLAARDSIQEGHFSLQFPDRRVEYRVSFTPSVHGQKLVLRVLDSRGTPTSLDELGLAGYMIDRIKRCCSQDHGMLLVCGPTGSGKTTTLYNALRQIDRQSLNVITIEDPVEYHLEGVTQIPTDDEKGHTFGQLLRSVLRQDPDVILVGEIRDEETARTAMQAAMTGHLVFSTVHAKDSISAVFRLLDLKVEPYLVANSLDLVLAQRLVRVLCEHCRRAVPVTPAQAIRIGRYLAGRTQIMSATGCARCLRTGYRGRRAIFELLDFTDDLRDTVLRDPTISAMKKVIETGLFTTLAQSGWKLVAEGVTTLDEVDRVAGQG